MKTAVVVVHGIGDPEPGDALRSLIDGLVATTPLRESGPRSWESREQPGDASSGNPLVDSYLVWRASMDTTPDAGPERASVHLREVYWGDLSRVRGSAMALVYALFDLIFGLRHIVYAAQESAKRACESGLGLVRLGNLLSSIALWLARGPMFALNVLVAVVAATTWLAVIPKGQQDLVPSPQLQDEAFWWAVAGSLLTAVAGAWLRGPLARRQWSPTTANSMLFFGLLMPLALWHWEGVAGQRSAMMFVEPITTVMSLFAFPMAMSAVLMVLLNALAMGIHSGDSEAARSVRRPLVVVTFCTSLSVMLFVFVVMVAWSVAADRLGEAGARAKAVPEATAAKPAPSAASVSQAATSATRSDGGPPVANLPLDARIKQGLHVFPFIWITLFAAALMFVPILIHNSLVSGAGLSRERWRYLIGSGVVVVFTALATVSATMFAAMIVHLEREPLCVWLGLRTPADCARPPNDAVWVWLADYSKWLGKWEEAFMPISLAASAGLAALFVAARSHFLSALDLVLDVIAHFKPAREGALGPKPPAPGQGQPAPWEQIVARFRDVVQTTVDTVQPKRLVIVSHSQGTTLALHGLGILQVEDGLDLALPKLNDELKLRLVTMGSPVGHLYRHYMPHRYTLNRTRCVGTLETWVNIYREDDFIGRRITDSPDAVPAAGDTAAPHEDVPVGPRGHTDYWRDRQVLDCLRRVIA